MVVEVSALVRISFQDVKSFLLGGRGGGGGRGGRGGGRRKFEDFFDENYNYLFDLCSRRCWKESCCRTTSSCRLVYHNLSL